MKAPIRALMAILAAGLLIGLSSCTKTYDEKSDFNATTWKAKDSEGTYTLQFFANGELSLREEYNSGIGFVFKGDFDLVEDKLIITYTGYTSFTSGEPLPTFPLKASAVITGKGKKLDYIHQDSNNSLDVVFSRGR